MSDKKGKNIWEQHGAPGMRHFEQCTGDGFVASGPSFAEVARGSAGRHEGGGRDCDMFASRNAEEKQNNNAQWYQDARHQPSQQQFQGPLAGYQKMGVQPQWQQYGMPQPGSFAEQAEVPFASMAQATYQHNSGKGGMYGPRNSKSLNNEESGKLFGQHPVDSSLGYGQEIATLGAAAQGPVYGIQPPQYLGKDVGFAPQFGELMNPRPSHLYPLEAHNLAAMSQNMGNLSLGFHQDDLQMHPWKDGHNAFAAHPLHNTHQSTWNQHGRMPHQQKGDDMTFHSVDESSVLTSGGQGSSHGTSLDDQKRSSSDSGGGSDTGMQNPQHVDVEQRHVDRNSGNGTFNRHQRSRPGNEGKNNKGYRKLWQHVTSVNKGTRLNNQRYQSGDSIVEDLLELVLSLPNDVPAIPAVVKGLHMLDAGALAALLKELNRNKCAHRAQEIFDWLRQLEKSNVLRQLCTTMTYTTMISQCGAQHALRRAMELMAEMKGRGISCNVHTYSALMNVCIKTGELNLALDVYKEMLSEGCTPNLVTFNTLIDVYGKTGQWEEAIAVLDAVEEKGLEPEARTYNTAIIACNQSSRAKEALQVYERMLKARARPTATTYTALISAYGKAGQLDQALEIFESMGKHKCEKNVITYSSLISACEKAGEWQLALKLFNDMHNDGCQPNVVTYNALIAACAQGAQAEKAQQIFDLMRKRGCRPDSVTFGALIGAYDKSGNWRDALTSFEVNFSSGCKPDTVVYNTIIGCLWRTGILRAQECAMKIFHFACKQGHFRMTVNSDKDSPSSRQIPAVSQQITSNRGQQLPTFASLQGHDADSGHSCMEFGMHAFTIGSAVLCLYRWLYELRLRYVADLDDSKDEKVMLTLNKGKPSREHTYPAIKEALLAQMKAWKLPLELIDVSIGCQIYGNPSDVVQSLDKGFPKSLLDQFGALANHELPPAQSVYQDDAMTEARCAQAFMAVRQFESLNQDFLNGKERMGALQDPSNLFVCMGLLAKSYSYPEDILYDGFDILMKFMEHGGDVTSVKESDIVGACYMLAVEQSSFDTHGAGGLLEDQLVQQLCGEIRSKLNGNTSSISSNRVLKLYLERLGVCFEGRAPANHPVAGVSFSLLPLSASAINTRRFPSSVIAAAVLITGRKNAGVSPFWPQPLEQMTGYKLLKGTELSEAVHEVSMLPALGPFWA